ncbi:MAG TPA: GNAT family N-acetyltransferase [Burkholderiales bacterium]|nr:GNAT family N-acetyltransferase [Burkholderiales bacterium]
MDRVVQKLVAFQRDEIIRHLRHLSPQDRRLRFGAPATDAAIESYAKGIDFARDKVFGIFEHDLALTGVAHLALDVETDTAELGLSVVPEHRGKGYGYALLARAKLHARNLTYKKLYMHCLAENQVMIHLARKAGMTVVAEFGEADAHVALGDGPLTDYTREAIHDQIALVDYLFKHHASWLTRKSV